MPTSLRGRVVGERNLRPAWTARSGSTQRASVIAATRRRALSVFCDPNSETTPSSLMVGTVRQSRLGTGGYLLRAVVCRSTRGTVPTDQRDAQAGRSSAGSARSESSEVARIVRALDATRQLRCGAGVWFEVELVLMAGPQVTDCQRQRLKPEAISCLAKVWDASHRRLLVSSTDANHDVIWERQLNSLEVALHHLLE